MPNTWQHPVLGTFAVARSFAGSRWAADVKVPAFMEFSYDTGYSNARRSTGKCALIFVAESEKEKPAAAQVQLAVTLVEGQRALADAIGQALWDEFNGRGPTSGMWWYDGLNDVARALGKKHAAPKGAGDVKRLLRVESIAVLDSYFSYRKPVIMLTFHAAFEQEHGVSVLTDGKSVLGSGYALEPDFYKSDTTGD